MNVLGQFEAQSLEQLDMEGQGSQPLVTTDNMGGVHQVIIHRMGKVIGGDAVRLQQDVVHIVFGDGQLALDQIVKLELIFDAAGAAEPQNPGIAGIQLCLHIFQGTVTPDGVLTVVTGGFLGSFLLFAHGTQLFLGAEAGIGQTFGHQLLGENMVDGSTLTLTVGTVVAVVTVNDSAFIELNTVVLQGVDQNFHSAGNFPLGIGIFHTKEQNTFTLVCHTLCDQPLNQVAQMDKAGGGGSHTGDDGTFRQIPLGEAGIHFFRGFGNIGEQQLGKSLIIHNKNLFFIKISEGTIPYSAAKVNFSLRFSGNCDMIT